MHRIIAPDNSATKPPAPVGTQGYAVAAPVGTIIPPEWHNSVQDEILGVIALKGGTPNPSNDLQMQEVLADAVLAVESGTELDGAPVSATNQRRRVVLGCTDGLAGAVSSGVDHCLTAASDNAWAAGPFSAVLASTNVRTLASGSFVAAVEGVSPGRRDVIEATGNNSAILAAIGLNFLSADSEACFAGGVVDAELAAAGAGAVASRDVVVAAAYSATMGVEHVAMGPDGSSANNFAGGVLGVLSAQRATIGGTSDPAEGCALLAIVDTFGSTHVSGTANAVIASGGVTNDGSNGAIRAAAVACGGGTVEAQESLMAGSNDGYISGANNTMLGCTLSSGVGGTARNGALGCENTTVGDVGNWMISGENCVMVGGQSRMVALASRYLDTSLSAAVADFQVLGGVNAGPAAGGPTWRINSQIGDFHGSGTYATGGADYAEFFENADGVAHPAGRLVSRVGSRVRLGQPGLRPLGPVSARPTVTGNDDSLGWAHQFLMDEWGALRLEDHVLADGRVIRLPVRNPEWSPEQARQHRPRRARPDEWTLVALEGQVIVAVESDVAADDFLCCGVDGLGRKSATETRLEVMEILSPFDASLGYGRALVLVR